MSREFNCTNCNGIISIKYLHVGEKVKCRYCGTLNVVPEGINQTIISDTDKFNSIFQSDSPVVTDSETEDVEISKRQQFLYKLFYKPIPIMILGCVLGFFGGILSVFINVWPYFIFIYLLTGGYLTWTHWKDKAKISRLLLSLLKFYLLFSFPPLFLFCVLFNGVGHMYGPYFFIYLSPFVLGFTAGSIILFAGIYFTLLKLD